MSTIPKRIPNILSASSPERHPFIIEKKFPLNWKKRIKIDIDYTNKIGAPVTHFPVAIFLRQGNGDTAKVFDEVGENKYKIAVTKSDGVTQLYVEIEEWDATNKKAVLHVSKSDWTINDDTYIYLYYDNSQPDNTTYVGDTPVPAVWDSYFKAVWHLREVGNGTAGEFKDSTSNSHNGQGGEGNSNYVPTQVDGLIGKAQQFDGTDDFISIPDSNDWAFGTNPFTLEAIGKMSTVANKVILAQAVDTNNVWVWGIHSGYPPLEFAVKSAGTWIIDVYGGGTAPSANTWYHWAIRKDSSGNYRAFVNGNIITPSNTPDTDAIPNFAAPLKIGTAIPWAGNYWHGILDEIRISWTARSDAWIKGTYNSLFDTLLSYGVEEK